jgi:DNA modification methylase
VGGDVEREGDPRETTKLAHALDVSSAPAPQGAPDDDAPRADDPDRVHVHGFHAYPARMHPETAARLVEAFGAPGATVLDPFAGSGTVLVEAVRLGRVALGTDLNPLAVLLASRKVAPRTERELARLVEAAAEARAFADERRARRAGASRRYPPEDARLFPPHVLLELDSLRTHVAAIERGPLRDDLSLVLSAILVKVSNRRGDTAGRARPRDGTVEAPPRRLAAGYTAKLFFRKAEELARRLREYQALLGGRRPVAKVHVADATALTPVAKASVDAIVTSPPYAATYDYLEHHALRLRWLGLEGEAFASGEMGARRTYARLDPASAARGFQSELERFFAAAKRVLRPRSPLVLLIADSEVKGTALRADLIVARAARVAGLDPVARASQARPHFHDPRAFAREPRREHALLLRTV